jgi:uncharacterized membrane protein YeaQ/YmgE (transglycosylase-associated protein family)
MSAAPVSRQSCAELERVLLDMLAQSFLSHHQIKALESFTMGWILFILFGLVVGLIARALMPGAQPMGFILTAILGMAGSFIGSYIGGLIQGGEGDVVVASDPYNWIGAVLGSLLLLFLYGLFTSKKTTV